MPLSNFIVSVCIVITQFCLTVFNVTAQTSKLEYSTIQVASKSIVIDGLLSEQEWNSVEWKGNFTQFKPEPESEASQKTEFKVLYDNNNLYIAIKAYDTEISKIVKNLTRRDGYEGDWVEVCIDSYFDKQTSFSFAASVSGVKNDGITTKDGESFDTSWDPIWYFKTSVADTFWIAEIQIPFSQLRFSSKEQQIWGFQITRRVYRTDERSSWSPVPKDAAGWVHYYGQLHGITGITPHKQNEVTLYSLGAIQIEEKELNNPFKTGYDSWFNAGVDGKLGLTNDITLNYTINPDFGQVENDPSEMNLSAFETFYTERRPFFVEGRNITNFPVYQGGGEMAMDNLFYTRRIGRKPQYEIDDANYDYKKQTDATSILGAAKLSGKTQNGLSIGLVESITSNEFAAISKNDTIYKVPIEPATNYFVSRVQKDLRNQNTIIGGMFTTTNRLNSHQNFDALHANAFSGGVDFQQYWKDKTYYWIFTTVASSVYGTSNALKTTQESSTHYFQRPDAKYLPYDTLRTSMQGNGGTISIGKKSNKKLRYDATITWRSPGLDINDLGYIRYTDVIMGTLWAEYPLPKPIGILRDGTISYSQWHGMNYSGANTFNGASINSYAEYTNYWHSSLGGDINSQLLDNTLLRGGPIIIIPRLYSFWGCTGTDYRKKVSFHINANYAKGLNQSVQKQNIGFSVVYKPVIFLKVTLNPNYYHEINELQWVQKVSEEYVFAQINLQNFSTTFRIDAILTPDISIQYYGQPFISAGEYDSFKIIINPRADNYTDRFQSIQDEIELDEDKLNYTLNSGETFENPDYNFKEYRSNLLLRWEFLPGSIVYLVWTQNTSVFDEYGNFDISRDLNTLFQKQASNIFLVKLSYRIGR